MIKRDKRRHDVITARIKRTLLTDQNGSHSFTRNFMHSALRLSLLGVVAIGLSGGAHTLPQNVPLPEGQFIPGLDSLKVEQLGEGLYTFRWEAYRSIFMVTDDGVIATDPQSTIAAEKYVAEIRKITDKPIKYLVYSHSHWDHESGGQIFKDEGATIIAQEECKKNMEMSPNPDVIHPDVTFKDTYSVELGGTSLDLYYFGPSHDTCLVVMIPRPHKMLYSVDIVNGPTGKYVPFDPVAADFHFYNAVNYLSEMEALAEREGLTSLIAAHLVPAPDGPGRFKELPTLGPIGAIAEKRIFWEQAINTVKQALDDGANPLTIQETLDTSAFEHYRGYDPEEFKILVRRISSYLSIGR